MNNAQKGSVHRQFYSSLHRQRVIQLVVPSGILVERIYGDITNPIDTDFTSLPGFSIFEYTDGNNVATKHQASTTEEYKKFTIQDPPTSWLNETGGIPYAISCWPSIASTYYTGIGVGTFNGVFGCLSKMRIHYPARGRVGFYYVYSSGTADCILQSSLAVNPASGFVDVFPPYPDKGPSGEAGWSMAVFFFGIVDEVDLPTAISNFHISNSTPFIFP